MIGSVNKLDYFVFLAGVSGALINVAAPGNYVRHAVIDDSGLHFGMAAIYAVLEVIHTFEVLMINTPFMLFILVAIVVGVRLGKTGTILDKKVLSVLEVICIGSPIISCFPVCLAYGGAGFPNRCKCIETVVMVISLIVLAVLLGYVMNRRAVSLFDSLHKGEICVISVFFSLLWLM